MRRSCYEWIKFLNTSRTFEWHFLSLYQKRLRICSRLFQYRYDINELVSLWFLHLLQTVENNMWRKPFVEIGLKWYFFWTWTIHLHVLLVVKIHCVHYWRLIGWVILCRSLVWNSLLFVIYANFFRISIVRESIVITRAKPVFVCFKYN